MTSSSTKTRLLDPFIAPKARAEVIYEINRRMAISVTCILFALIGIPIGIKLQSSTQLAALTITMTLSFAYFMLGIELSKKLYDSTEIPALGCAWGPHAIFGSPGFYLYWKILFRW